MSAKANILLVDDKLSNLTTLEAVLTPLGQNLVLAASGEEALLALLEQEFALILLDVQMANMDGIETAKLIKQRERSKSIPIIFVTANFQDEQHLYRGYASGAADYLFKPVVPEILRAKVIVFVDLYLKRREIQEKTKQLEAINHEIETQLRLLQELNQQLETANLELESFSFSVSHDLRSPLRSIHGFSQALLRTYSPYLDDEGKDFLKRIVNACEAMGILIDDLLQLSRVIRGTLDIQTIDLAKIARDVLDRLQSANLERNVEILIHQDLRAKGDNRLLYVVLDNLLGNAWKFTVHNRAALIEIGRELKENSPVFYVRDNGAGFDMKRYPQLFQPFQRLHSEAEFEGTGIGLATVRRIIHRHGGEIWAEAEIGKGASFYFTLGEREVEADRLLTK